MKVDDEDEEAELEYEDNLEVFKKHFNQDKGYNKRTRGRHILNNS